VIFWRREPRFRKVVRPEEPLKEVYCRVTEPEEVKVGSPCRKVEGTIPRLAGVWAIPHKGSKLIEIGERFGLIGGTFLLYPGLLRPGACFDDKGNSNIAYLCVYPDFSEFTEKGWKAPLEGKYFRLRDDVEEVGYYEDRLGHPVYIVRNALGETFRMTGVYARIYHILRERGGWVEGEVLVKEAADRYFKYLENAKEFVDGVSDEKLEELFVEFGNTALEIADRISDLTIKLTRGEVEELPQPGSIPGDLERLIAKYEPLESLYEMYNLGDLAQAVKHRFESEGEALWTALFTTTKLALGLLVYEALLVEMGILTPSPHPWEAL
jgi:hypothetical protein